MKKFRILPIIFAVLLMLCGCAKRVCPTGSWKLISLNEGGSVMDAAALEENGRSGYLVMKEDGSGVLRLDGIDNDVTWKNGYIEQNGERQRCVMDKEILQIGDRNANMRFEAWDGVLPPLEAGYWVMTGYGNQTFPIEESENYFYLVLNEDGSGYLYFAGTTGDFTWEPGVIHAASDLAYTLDGNSMRTNIDGTDVVFEKSPKQVPELTESYGYSGNEDVWHYRMYAFDYQGKAYEEDGFQKAGISSEIVINADGTGMIELNGAASRLTYDDKYMYFNDNQYEYTIVDDGFELMYEDFVLKFIYYDPAAKD